MHAPTTMHFDFVYRILRYLKHNLGAGFLYSRDLIYTLRDILMRIGLVLSLIAVQPLAIALLLVVTLLLGVVRNSLLLPVLVR